MKNINSTKSSKNVQVKNFDFSSRTKVVQEFSTLRTKEIAFATPVPFDQLHVVAIVHW